MDAYLFAYWKYVLNSEHDLFKLISHVFFSLQDGHYFLDVMRREEKRIQDLCTLAENDLQDNHGEDGKTIL